MKKTFESTQTAVRTPLKLAAAAAAALLILSGCAVGPNYTRPSAVSQMPAQFKEAPAGWKSATPNDAALKGDWWTMYDDPVLNSLSMVGNILIFCVGVNLIWPKTIKVANLLPALIVAVLMA